MATRLRCVVSAALVFLSVGVVAPAARAADPKETFPSEILIIRHAEKPNDEAIHGLNDKGKTRAAGLILLFEADASRPAALPKPDFIFATKDSKASERPRDTVTPLAASFKLSIDARFGNEHSDKLARELFGDPKYAGKVVLVCWHHGTLNELATNLRATGVPTKKFDSTVFDRVWRIPYDVKGKEKFKLIDEPQRLLFGDADK